LITRTSWLRVRVLGHYLDFALLRRDGTRSTMIVSDDDKQRTELAGELVPDGLHDGGDLGRSEADW
jgi:hypothetical protein